MMEKNNIHLEELRQRCWILEADGSSRAPV